MLQKGLILAFLFSAALPAAVVPHIMPRNPSRSFTSDGLFEGGNDLGANIEGVRFAQHKAEGYERWVIDFSDAQRNLGAAAPRYQLRYETSEKLPLPEGGDLIKRPARFLFVFRMIQKNNLVQERLKKLVKKSHFVKDIILYPPIERGDMALEFVLKDDVKFTPHQPSIKEGRLVLDLKALR